MSYLDWHVGMKVVCIASVEEVALAIKRVPKAKYPFSGGVYTIRDIFPDEKSGEILIYLKEVDNQHLVGTSAYPGTFCYREPASPARLFRPVQPKKTDISIFTAMLHDQRQKVPV